MFLRSALLSLGLPVETRQHDDKEGCDVEKEEAGEESAEPGEQEQAGAHQGEVEHGGGGLQQCTMCILGTTMALWSKAEKQKKYTF